MLKEQERRVTVWLGNIADRAQWEAYLEETYGDDDAPINQLAADAGEWFYDHDLQEAGWHREPVSIPALLEGHSWADTFVESVTTAAAEVGIGSANAVVVLYDHAFEGNWPAASMVALVGTFAYQPGDE